MLFCIPSIPFYSRNIANLLLNTISVENDERMIREHKISFKSRNYNTKYHMCLM
jgi:hypothetical protein